MRNLLARGSRFGSFQRASSTDAQLNFRHGLPVITVTLPSRNEPVSFTCKPVTGTIGDLLVEIKGEDKGVDHAAIFAQVNN
jgi:hypothetical protein